MMDAWSITSKKRKATPVQFTGKKRPRHTEPSSSDGRRQQTLTQAQWVDRPSSFSEDADLTPVASTKVPKRKKITKRDSTLTQMQFFGREYVKDEGMNMITIDGGDADEPPIPQSDGVDQKPHKARRRTPVPVVKDEEPDLIQEADNADIPHIPQFDGLYQSPRRPRKRKIVPVLKEERTESQEYQPTKKKERIPDKDEAFFNPRRSSRRLAEQPKILSDPAENLEYFSKALQPSPQSQRSLEIQDSTAGTEIIDISSQSPIKTPVRAGRMRDERIVPSSQSPDSLILTAGRSTVRRPLAELSSNARAPPSTPLVYQQSPFGKENLASARGTTLKKPAKDTSRRKVEDSQNLWSIQLTSSPPRPEDPVIVDDLPDPPLARDGRSESRDDVEIPSTSQAEAETPTAPPPVAENVEAEGAQTGQDQSVNNAEPVTEDSGIRDEQVDTLKVANDLPDDNVFQALSPRAAAHQVLLAANTPPQLNSLPPLPAEAEGDDFDFGSPIRNDTQFNLEVKERTSPLAASEAPITIDSNPSTTRTTMTSPRKQNVSRPPAERNDTSEVTQSIGLPPARTPTSYPGYTTTRVPLNDMQPPSSQSLPSDKSTTQRSVRPASMQHPSQVSTQEATQGYTGSSFLPPDTPRSQQRITIKDSSSVRMAMSQIPQQAASQSQLIVDFGLDMYDDEDYDLDPPSSGIQAAEKASKNPSVTTQRLPTASSPSPSPREERGRVDTTVDEEVARADEVEQDDEDLDITPKQPQPMKCSHSKRKLFSRYDDTPKTRSQQGTKAAAANLELDQQPDPIQSTPREQPSISKAQKNKAQPGNGKQKSDSPTTHKIKVVLNDNDADRGDDIPRYESQSTPLPKPLSEYTPLEGYNNTTLANFTQGGHISAAYIHRQRARGLLPEYWTPKCFIPEEEVERLRKEKTKVPGYTKR